MLRRNLRRFSWFFLLLYLFLINSQFTDADIFAERVVEQNTLKAITLDFSTRTTFNHNLNTKLFNSFGFLPNGFDVASILIKNESQNYFKYHLKTVKISGHDELCNNLELNIFDSNFKKLYQGRLIDLNLNSEINEDSNESYIFLISLENDNDNLKSKICEFNFDFKSYRKTVDETGGIFAQRKLNNVITSGSW